MLKELPDLLLTHIAEFQTMLEKHKAHRPDSDAAAFYTKHLEVLYLTYKYMVEGWYSVHDNQLLRHQWQVQSAELKRLQTFHDSVMNIVALKSQDKYTEMLEIAKAITLRNIDLRTQKPTLQSS